MAIIIIFILVLALMFVGLYLTYKDREAISKKIFYKQLAVLITLVLVHLISISLIFKNIDVDFGRINLKYIHRNPFTQFAITNITIDKQIEAPPYGPSYIVTQRTLFGIPLQTIFVSRGGEDLTLTRENPDFSETKKPALAIFSLLAYAVLIIVTVLYTIGLFIQLIRYSINSVKSQLS